MTADSTSAATTSAATAAATASAATTSAATTSAVTSSATEATSSVTEATSAATTTGAETTTTGAETTTTTGAETTTTTGAETTGRGDTLCGRLGGESGIHELHLGFLGRVLIDEQINAYFLNADVEGAALVSCLDRQIGEAVGCEGVVYDCLDMGVAHAGMKISSLDFSDLVSDYASALDEHQTDYPALSDADKAGILATLAGMAGEIVEDVNDNATIYQRSGRKPGLKALIGSPGAAMSFIGIIMEDAAVNGFFGAADFERLNTCLTRQLVSVDGPARYGMEVDSPAVGVDDGVSLADPCKDMLASHAGVTDAKDNSLITLADFAVVINDLVAAMDAVGLKQSDQDALIGALGELCMEIVADSPNDCPGGEEETFVVLHDLAMAIPDGAYNGTPSTMACVELMVGDSGVNLVKDVKLTVRLDHSWIGDLVIKVFSPEGTAITVLSVPGALEGADDGATDSPEGSDLNDHEYISFFDGAPNDAEEMGSTIPHSFAACTHDNRCDYFPNAGAATPGTFASLANEGAVGAWKVCFGDVALPDEGVLAEVGLTISKVKTMIP